MPIKLANNASTRLAAPLSSVATSITVESGGGDKFPVTGSGDYFPMTIVASDGQLEIVKCTARSGDTFTIERAQEGTTAKEFNAGAAIELRLTAGAMTSVIDEAEDRLQDVVDSLDGFKIGDYLTTARNPGENWLRRDGSSYASVDYPDLAPLMPEAPVGVAWTPKGSSGLPSVLTRPALPLWDAVNSQYVLFAFKTASASGQPLCKFTSPTGEVWTEKAITGLVPASNGSTWAAEGNGSVVFFLRGTPSYLGYSTNWGSTWKVPSTPPPAPNMPTSICWDPDGERFLLTTNNANNSNARLWSSPTGAVWTLLSDISAIGNAMGTAQVHAGGGKVFVSDGFGGRYISHNQGTTFEAIDPPAGESSMTMPFHYGSGFAFVCAGKVYTTTDFVTYKLVVPTNSVANAIFSTYGGGVVTAVSSSALAYSLDDGETWFVTTFTGTEAKFCIGDPNVASGKFYVCSTIASKPAIEVGIRALPGSFLVPDDNPINGWIKAK